MSIFRHVLLPSHYSSSGNLHIWSPGIWAQVNEIIKTINWEEKQSDDHALRKGTDSAKWQQIRDTESKLYRLLKHIVNRNNVKKKKKRPKTSSRRRKRSNCQMLLSLNNVSLERWILDSASGCHKWPWREKFLQSDGGKFLMEMYKRDNEGFPFLVMWLTRNNIRNISFEAWLSWQ